MAKNHSSSHEKTSELEKVFNRFDANGDGKVSASELASVMRALGSPPSVDELSRMMAEMDADGDGFVDLKEFVEFYGEGGGGGGGGGGDGKEIRDAFEMYDQNKDGKISAKELHRVLKSLGERCSVEDCSRMIRSVDSDGDGSVNFEEFKEMMSRGKI
ncbi:putative calcium-binding protein CML18 [Cinnamomum micranthum f. kanehirae]|uniref:Putative calcium-binding protein CML18 n=1 Tax=Cinnamomum micranthum f. kanehirae TaxID=337451 RepID=A0A3S3Q5A7_9MAGN|nr:putative calcium-binding protein CML18 [Cinnamomum micranthum f. kanehirae]